MELPESELRALRALGSISDGYNTFMNVTDADKLVSKDLAIRFGKGQFSLTDLGRFILERERNTK